MRREIFTQELASHRKQKHARRWRQVSVVHEYLTPCTWPRVDAMFYQRTHADENKPMKFMSMPRVRCDLKLSNATHNRIALPYTGCVFIDRVQRYCSSAAGSRPRACSTATFASIRTRTTSTRFNFAWCREIIASSFRRFPLCDA